MSKENDNILQARLSVKAHIKFLESLLEHLKSPNKLYRGRAMWAAWCLNGYLNDQFIKDIEYAIEKNTPPEGKHDA